jgi:cytochrome c-type biogenesis protein CcmH/NrfG
MRLWAALVLLIASAAAPLNALAAAGRPPPATLKRDFDNCRAHANLDACYDAVRWNPSDPVLLVALGDALAAANRQADALRTYRRASVLAPGTHGLNAKISATEAKLSKHAGNTAPRGAAHAAAEKHYSNIAPDSQSH